jgi:hypothetical protein
VTVYFLLFLAIGKLLIYLGMKFPPLAESRFEFIRRQWECDLCCGVIVYSALSLIMGEALFGDHFYVPFISEGITGGIASFIVHLISMGYKEKFGVIVIG